MEAGPASGSAYWLTTSDDVRIRIGVWNADHAKGTVLLFPGRTEYIEKYGKAAHALTARGYTTLAIDWRGQGLADRFLDDPLIGHVKKFDEYQKDVDAVLAAAQSLNLPQPYFLMGHSMGGCIGLRALHNGLPVAAAAFTGPMWGIRISMLLRPVAWVLSRIMPVLNLGYHLPPGRKPEPYVHATPFEGNTLTTDRETWHMMVQQITNHPELGLGGPSYVWLREALAETAEISAMPAPDVPCATFVGENERIVHVGRIRDLLGRWTNGDLHVITAGEHEILMESQDITDKIFDTMTALFDAAGGSEAG